MERLVPWGEVCTLIEPVYPNPEVQGRRSVGLERMLRIYFLQHWFNLHDGCEAARRTSIVAPRSRLTL